MRLLSAAGAAVVSSVALASAADPFNCTSFPAAAFEPLTLTNNVKGMAIRVIPYGATMVNVLVPDATGTIRDVILGFDDATQYCSATHPYFGAAIGRVANRIANGTFQLDGQTYSTPINEVYAHPPAPAGAPAGDTLHGGTVGWDRRQWSVVKQNASSVTFGLLSADGDMGFPGDLAVLVAYTLTDKTATSAPAWDVQYTAVTSAPKTVLAMSQHTYWNLNANVGNVPTATEHVLSIDGGAYVAVDGNLIPTGQVPSVDAAPWLDFRTAKPIGRDIANGTVAPGGGYDNAWVFEDWVSPGTFQARATISSPLTGIAMTMETNQPSVQFYSGNFLDGSLPRKASQCYDGVPPGPQCGYMHWGCAVLEAQHYPDSVHNPAFPSIELAAGETYRWHTRYNFVSV